MNKIIPIIVFIAAIAVSSCQNDNTDEDITTNDNSGSKITSLQAIVSDPNVPSTINLSEYKDIDNFDATIDKAITINGAANINFNSANITVNVDNVSLSGIVNANVTTTASLGSGSLKISHSSLSSLTLNGGGANSIHIQDCSIDTTTANYDWVRIHIMDKSTKLKNVIAAKNCKIEDDMSTDTIGSNSNSIIGALTIGGNVITEVKTVIDTLNLGGDYAEINLSRPNSYVKSIANSVTSSLLDNFRLTSIEEVKVDDILNSIGNVNGVDDEMKQQLQYKTSDCLVYVSTDGTNWDNVSYNFDGFVKAWKKYKDDTGNQAWTNYVNLRVLDKYNGKPITTLVPKAFQMSQWLTSIDIGDNVSHIGELAFLGCSNLTTIYMRPITPPTVDATCDVDQRMLFFTTDDPTTDKTSLDRELFSPKSDFISADGIDYFVEWYKQSDYVDSECVDLINDLTEVLSGPLFQPYNVSTIGQFLKSKPIWDSERTIKMACQSAGLDDFSPSVVLDKIITEWDKTLTALDITQVTIYVPEQSVETYKNAPVWKRYADRIFKIPSAD